VLLQLTEFFPITSTDSIEVAVVCLPGRAKRMSDPPLKEIVPLVNEIVNNIFNLTQEKTFAFYGHSLGSLLAFESIHEILRRGGKGPVVFMAGAISAVHLRTGPKSGEPLIRDFNVDQMIELLRKYGGTAPEVLESRELMSFILPTLKADFGMAQEYIYVKKEQLDIPIVSFVGTKDAVPMQGAKEWSQHTTKIFTIHTIEGSHFFHQENPTQLTSLISNEISKYL